MKINYEKGATLVHISPEDMIPVLSEITKSKKTVHKITREFPIGYHPSQEDFEPQIPNGTRVGMMFIEGDGKSGERLLYLSGGISFKDMGIEK